MRYLLEEYGKNLLALMAALILMGGIFGKFITGWRELGAVDDSVKTRFERDEEKRQPPIIRARDFKLHKGETLDFGRYVTAVDFDGSDISALVKAVCERREGGICTYSLRVKSPVTGKSASGRLLVLVDSPLRGGVGEQ